MAVILLENVRSTLNVGGIFRIADAVGAEKIVLVGYTPAPIDRMGRENERLKKLRLVRNSSCSGDSIRRLKKQSKTIRTPHRWS